MYVSYINTTQQCRFESRCNKIFLINCTFQFLVYNINISDNLYVFKSDEKLSNLDFSPEIVENLTSVVLFDFETLLETKWEAVTSRFYSESLANIRAVILVYEIF